MGSADQNSWKPKVHPAFLLGAEAFKEAIQSFASIGKDAPSELSQKIMNRLSGKVQEIWSRYPELKSPTGGLLYSSSSDLRLGDLEHLHWRRHRRPLHQDRTSAQADDLGAFGRMNRTNDDYIHWRRGQNVKDFQIDTDHWTLLEMGFDLGLNKLSSEELADCFDAVCPCGCPHDADALKKQRERLRAALQDAKRMRAF
jgi:hypothetical protein